MMQREICRLIHNLFTISFEVQGACVNDIIEDCPSEPYSTCWRAVSAALRSGITANGDADRFLRGGQRTPCHFTHCFFTDSGIPSQSLRFHLQ